MTLVGTCSTRVVGWSGRFRYWHCCARQSAKRKIRTASRMVLEAVLTAAESIVTFRRHYRGRAGVDALLELLVIDPFNPRSVAYQLQRIRTDLRDTSQHLADGSTLAAARQSR